MIFLKLVIQRLHSFLPQIAKANKDLEKLKDSSTNVDIEHIEDEEKPYIEMDLGLGVFDLKPKKGSSNGDNDDSDTGSSSDSDNEIIVSPDSKKSKNLPRPHIELINKHDQNPVKPS